MGDYEEKLYSHILSCFSIETGTETLLHFAEVLHKNVLLLVLNILVWGWREVLTLHTCDTKVSWINSYSQINISVRMKTKFAGKVIYFA